MRNWILGIVTMVSMCINCQSQNAKISNGVLENSNFITATYIPSVGLLYSQTGEGDMDMDCTVTAIEKNADGYVFISAGHCACEEDQDEKTVTPAKTSFFITSDNAENKHFIKAVVTGCGYRHAGDDFAIFQVNTKDTFPVVPLGTDPVVLEQVANVASPLGLGKQVFLGSVSSSKLERPAIQGDINWTGAILLQMVGVNGGSSGSSIVCMDQRAICGFIVGTIGNTNTVAIPVSRLISLRKKLAEGTYKNWVPDPDSHRVGSEKK